MVGRGTAARRVTVVVIALALVVGAVVFFVTRYRTVAEPACTVAGTSAGSGGFTLSPEQADNAATITAVGLRLGMPDHAVTVALATALQESKLTNLTGGDRDSAGLFQQRPSQGWGTFAQVTDPVYASTAFYGHLRKISGWRTLSVTEAAQRVQHSGAPEAYAQWESEARALAVALTGEAPAAFTCGNLSVTASRASVAAAATAEWGTDVVSGPHPTGRGWAMAGWLVAHATRFGVDQVSFAGRTWTAASGTWSKPSGSAPEILTLHQVAATNG
jgi:hypothetical protein